MWHSIICTLHHILLGLSSTHFHPLSREVPLASHHSLTPCHITTPMDSTTPEPLNAQHEYWILALISCFHNWCIAWIQYGCSFNCFVTLWALVIDKHFLCPKFCYQLMYYSILPCQGMQYRMLHEQQQMVLMQSNVWRWTHVLLLNMPCLQMHTWWKQQPSN